jgi:hypothetical protein
MLVDFEICLREDALTDRSSIHTTTGMATKPKANQSEQLDLDQLVNQEAQLRKQLEELQQSKKNYYLHKSEEIQKSVSQKLKEIQSLISPLLDDDAWTWKNYEMTLDSLGLKSKEAKPLEVSEEFVELVVEFLKTKPSGATINDISEGIVDSNGKSRYVIGSLRPKLPLLVAEKHIKSKKSPVGRMKLYYVE